jgi:hypothetical protein
VNSMVLFRVQPDGQEHLVSCQQRPSGLPPAARSCLLRSPLADGDYRLEVRPLRVTSNGYAVEPPTDLPFRVRADAPAAPTLQVGRAGSAEAGSSPVSGTAPSGTTVQVVATGADGTTQSAALPAVGGHWSGSLDLRALPDGEVTVVARRPDLAGSTVTAELDKDTVPPALLSLTAGPGSAHGGVWRARTSEARVQVQVTATDRWGASAVDGVRLASTDGVLVDDDLDAFHLSDGDVSMQVRLQDRAGNVVVAPPAVVHKQSRPTVDEAWARLRAEGTDLGGPIGPERKTGCAATELCAAEYARAYAKGEIWSSARSGGTYEVHGGILEAWQAAGGAAGPLGAPGSDEQPYAGGRRSEFTGGAVVWSPRTGAVPLSGRVLHR